MDKELTKIILAWKKECHIHGIIQLGAYPTTKPTLTICTPRPGAMIGKGGTIYAKYLKRIQRLCPTIQNIEFVETHSWYIK